MINLLPWRELKRKKQQQQLLLLFSALAIVLIIGLLGCYLFLKTEIHQQQAVYNKIKKQSIAIRSKQKSLVKINNEITYFQQQLTAIKILQQHKQQFITILKELATSLPHTIYLSELSGSEQDIKITGIAKNHAAISEFSHNLSKLNWCAKPLIGKVHVDNFIIECKKHAN